ncbi:hypothetical protein ATO13_23766 [Stappia sp. 22II-S9-Z10]|nr:hypothetical protein ATO13_23766 [Stappia sp. 22II-S9-Z10]
MKLLSIISVKDDLEVIGPATQNRLAAGFDEVVIVAVEPSEEMAATAQALTRGDPRVRALAMAKPDAAGAFLSFTAEPMATILSGHPDWVLVSDADEFVVAERPVAELPELAGEAPLSVPRYNYARRRGEVPGEMAARLRDPACLPLIAERRQAFKDGVPVPGVRWLEHRISPRPMFRPRTAARFDVGAHHLIGADGARQPTTPAVNLLMAHLPFTSFPRFSRKIDNVAAHLSDVAGVHATTASHWKEWLKARDGGRLGETFEAEAFGAEEFEARRAEGSIDTASGLFVRLKAGDKSVR